MSVLSAVDVRVLFNQGEPEEVEAIRNISFELEKGETLAIVGPSGCGKSTLFNAIAGLIEPSAGSVVVEGKRVDRATGHVGYMLQKDLLLPWRSVLDNILLGLEVRGAVTQADRARVLEMVHRYGLAGFESAKPAQLSGGMRQRVAFMRTLAIDPGVILLDEPFSALDFQTRLVLQAEVMAVIRERGKSVVLVTHDIGEAITMADRIVVLTNRPAQVKSVHRIDLDPEERNPIKVRSSEKYNQLFQAIWAELGIQIGGR
jgi:NitT/TauT family transport system ATP-binding protein